MITKSTFAFIAAIAVVGVASPAFAQAFDPEMGTGNIVGVNIGPAAPQQRSGLQAYARVPDTRAATGSASSGYEELLKAQW
jgi:hypothetical protein